MASDKQRRKAARAARPRKPGEPHPDGDRRRKNPFNTQSILRDKKARREFPGIPNDE